MRWRVALVWGLAAVVSVTTHGAGLAWLLRTPPVPIADNTPPPSIMIEMAAEPEAVNTEEDTISEDVQESAEVKSEAEEPAEPLPEPVPEPPQEMAETPPPVEEPPPDIPPPPEPLPEEPEVVEETPPPVQEEVEVPLPAPKPVPVEEPPPPEPPKPRPQEVAKPKPPREKPAPRPAPAAKAANAAAAQVAPSQRNAASQTVAGSGFGSVSPARWQSKLMAHLERRKRYPSGARSRGEQGTVQVRFSIDTGGNVLSVSLARSSGFAELDQAVLDLVRRASPVPAPPVGVNRTIVAPVRFTSR